MVHWTTGWSLDFQLNADQLVGHHLEVDDTFKYYESLKYIQNKFINGSWRCLLTSDWVMSPNVYGMGLFSDGGIFTTKPYICGSSYFLKMMHFLRDLVMLWMAFVGSSLTKIKVFLKI